MGTLGRVAPPVALMAVIFLLSAQPDLNSGLGVWDTILRKIAHAVEYGLLWFLWWRALRYRGVLVAAAIALAYAVSDEWHQSFVDGRVGSPLDVAIDATGIAIALVLAHRLRRRRPGTRRSGAGAGRAGAGQAG